MEKGWTAVFNTQDEYLVSIAQELLQENGIESVVVSNKDSSYVFLGEIELYVSDEDKEQAIKIIEHLKKG